MPDVPTTHGSRRGEASRERSVLEVKKPSEGFTQDERAAMRGAPKELSRRALERERGERRAPCQRSQDACARSCHGQTAHALIKSGAPGLSPKLWYGMPAYAKDGNVVCFFQGAEKFKTRYATLGFSDKATLDQGRMWPTAFALKELTAAEEAGIRALLQRAVKQ
jgi:hypothetical protein